MEWSWTKGHTTIYFCKISGNNAIKHFIHISVGLVSLHCVSLKLHCSQPIRIEKVYHVYILLELLHNSHTNVLYTKHEHGYFTGKAWIVSFCFLTWLDWRML